MSKAQQKKVYSAEEKARFEEAQKKQAANEFNLAVRKEDAIRGIYEYLNKNKNKLSATFGKKSQSIIDQCVSGVVAVLQKSEPDKKGIALYHCRPESFFTAIRDSVQHQIPIDGRGLGYLVRYGMEVRFTPGYKGYIHRVCEHNPSTEFQTGLVFERDELEVFKQDGVAHYKHKCETPFPSKKDMAENLSGAYCYISYQINGYNYSHIELIGKDDISIIRSKAKSDNVWDEFFSEQIKKAIIRRACKVPFAKVVNDLDELDNQNFDLNKEDHPQKRSSWDDALQKEREAMEKKNTIEGEAVVTDTKDIPADTGTGGVNEPDNLPSEEKGQAGPAGMAEWDGKIAIPFLPQEEMPIMYNTPQEAVVQLVEAMQSTDSKRERSKMIDENAPLFGALLKTKDKSAIKYIEECHKLEAEAEHD